MKLKRSKLHDAILRTYNNIITQLLSCQLMRNLSYTRKRNELKIKNFIFGVFKLVLFLALLANYAIPIGLDSSNNDLGRHLLLGKIIVTTTNIPKVNLLSYTFGEYPFVNTHWLSEVIFYIWHTIFGFNGLIVLSILLITTTASLIFNYAFKRIDAFTTILISLIFLPIMAGRVQVRPELFSFLYLSIFIVILFTFREKYSKWIFALIPIQLLWVNSHIYFFTGIVVLLLFLVDAFISNKVAITSKKFLTLLFVTVVVGLISLLNPNFIKGALYPLFVLNEYGITTKENINYFTALRLFQQPILYYFAGALVLLWTSVLIAYKKMEPIDYLLCILFSIMGFFAVRDFPLFAIGTFIPAVKASSYLMKLVLARVNKRSTLSIYMILFSLVFASIVPSIKSNILMHKIGFGVIEDARGAVDFLINNNIRGNIYNNFGIGSYLEYRLYPREKAFIDNRPEAYPPDFLQNTYRQSLISPNVFNQVDDKYNFNVIFIDHVDSSQDTRKFLNWLSQDKEWSIVYLNNMIVVFIKVNSSNQPIINKYAINQDNVRIDESDFFDKNKMSRWTNFFSKVGWERQLLNTAIVYLKFEFDPADCPVLAYVINTLKKQEQLVPPDYIDKYIRFCKPLDRSL